jgi:hypothetical protein
MEIKMTPVRVYIAGPMESAGGNWNFPLFDFAAERLRALGCEVFNPADHIRETFGTLDAVKALDKATLKLARKEALRDEFLWIFNFAEILFLLQGWERSPGATAERALALAIGVKIYEADTIIPGLDFQVMDLNVDIDA